MKNRIWPCTQAADMSGFIVMVFASKGLRFPKPSLLMQNQ